MDRILKVITLLISAGFGVVACSPPRASISYSSLEFNKVDGTSKLSAYSTTIHPLLTQNCISCHGHNSTATPHSSADAAESLKIVEAKRLVNLADPGNSIFIQRILSGHNCGSAERCTMLKDAMLEAIGKYATAVAKFEKPIVYTEKTGSLGFKNGQERVPDLINGVLIVPAHLTSRSGRAGVIADGNALTGKVWFAPHPYPHPSGFARWIDTGADNSSTRLSPSSYTLNQGLHFYGVDGRDPFYTTPVCFTVMQGDPKLSSSAAFRYLNGNTFVDVNGCFTRTHILPRNIFGGSTSVGISNLNQANLLAAINSLDPKMFAAPRFDNTYPFLANTEFTSPLFKAKAAEVLNGLISDKQIADFFLPELRATLYSGTSLLPKYTTAVGLSSISLSTVADFRARIRLALGASVTSDYRLNGVLNSEGVLQPVTITRAQVLNPARVYVGKGNLPEAPNNEFYVPDANGLTPAAGSFPFRVLEPGRYKFHFRSKVIERGEARGVRLSAKVLSRSTGAFVRNTGNNYVGSIDSAGNDRTGFMWRSTGSLEFNLNPGLYELHFHERNDGVAVDEIAIVLQNSNPHQLVVRVPNTQNEFRENQLNDYFFSNPRPRILSYDLSSILGPGYRFEVEIFEYSSTAYGFVKPRFVLNGKNVKVKGIGLLVNGRAGISFDQTFSAIEGVAGTGDPMSYTLMTVLKDKGLNQDVFSFVFGTLELTDLPGTDFRPASPLPPPRERCYHLDLFEKTVMPIYQEFRVMRRGEYDGFLSQTARLDRNNPQVYTCSGCHSNTHPTFNMALEAEDFCLEAVKRIDDWKNPENAKLLRGLNVSFGHDASRGALGDLYVLEAAELDSSKSNTDYKRVEVTVRNGDKEWQIEKRMASQLDYFADAEFGEKVIMQTRPKRNASGEILGVNGAPLIYRERLDGNNQPTGEVLYERPYDAAFEDVPYSQRSNNNQYKQVWPLEFQRTTFLQRFPRVSTVLNSGRFMVGTRTVTAIGDESIGALFDPVAFCSRVVIPGTDFYAYDATEFAADRDAMVSYCGSLRAHRNSVKSRMESVLAYYKAIVVHWIRQECLSRYSATECGGM